MKTGCKYLATVALGVAFLAIAHAVDIPRLGAVYYGQILSPYGNPCSAGDGVRLSTVKTNGTVAAYVDIGSTLGPGINYRLQVDYVASGSSIDGTSVSEGGTIHLQATLGSQPINIIGQTNIVVSSGVVSNMFLVLGTDVNGDGLPDEWQQMVIDAMNALGMTNAPASLAQFNANSDYDSDGVNNRNEFLAGTLPFLASDYPRIQKLSLDPRGKYVITLFGNDGFNYQIHTSSDPMTGSWDVTQFATNGAATQAQSLLHGANAMQDLYFPTNGLREFIRLIVK